MAQEDVKSRSERQRSNRREQRLTRRAVIKLGAMVGATLPLIITLTPTEAKAQGTGS